MFLGVLGRGFFGFICVFGERWFGVILRGNVFKIFFVKEVNSFVLKGRL